LDTQIEAETALSWWKTAPTDKKDLYGSIRYTTVLAFFQQYAANPTGAYKGKVFDFYQLLLSAQKGKGKRLI
jgi:hypothetical protein